MARAGPAEAVAPLPRRRAAYALAGGDQAHALGGGFDPHVASARHPAKGANTAIVRIFSPPSNREEHEAITREIGPEENPPAGMILHAAGETDGQWQIVEVWESAEAADRFDEERVRPALERVMGGATPEIGVPPTVYEAQFVVRGK